VISLLPRIARSLARRSPQHEIAASSTQKGPWLIKDPPEIAIEAHVVCASCASGNRLIFALPTPDQNQLVRCSSCGGELGPLSALIAQRTRGMAAAVQL
jgi:hypothetical protein